MVACSSFCLLIGGLGAVALCGEACAAKKDDNCFRKDHASQYTTPLDDTTSLLQLSHLDDKRRMAHSGGESKDSSHGQAESVFACPGSMVQPDLASLDKMIALGPVELAPKLTQTNASTASKKKPHETRHHHVFITGMPYTGTTAVLSLLSTSPESSNLCSAGRICCEGSWLLEESKLVPREDKQNPLFPQNWTDALKEFNRYWDQSKTVFLEKSPTYLYKFTRLWDQIRGRGIKASFVYLVNSPCYKSNSPEAWYSNASLLSQEIHKLREMKANVIVLKAEELRRDPYIAVEQLLESVPELGSLDPTRSGVDSAPYVSKDSKDERSEPVAYFVRNTHGIQMNGPEVQLSLDVQTVMSELGYTREWFETSYVPSDAPRMATATY